MKQLRTSAQIQALQKTHLTEEQLQSNVLKLKTQLDEIDKLENIFKGDTDVNTKNQIDFQKQQLRQQLNMLQQQGVDFINVLSKINKNIIKADFQKANDYIQNQNIAGSNANDIVDLYNEDGVLLKAGIKRQSEPYGAFQTLLKNFEAKQQGLPIIPLTDYQLEQIKQQIDINKDGELSDDELRQYLQTAVPIKPGSNQIQTLKSIALQKQLLKEQSNRHNKLTTYIKQLIFGQRNPKLMKEQEQERLKQASKLLKKAEPIIQKNIEKEQQYQAFEKLKSQPEENKEMLQFPKQLQDYSKLIEKEKEIEKQEKKIEKFQKSGKLKKQHQVFRKLKQHAEEEKSKQIEQQKSKQIEQQKSEQIEEEKKIPEEQQLLDLSYYEGIQQNRKIRIPFVQYTKTFDDRMKYGFGKEKIGTFEKAYQSLADTYNKKTNSLSHEGYIIATILTEKVDTNKKPEEIVKQEAQKIFNEYKQKYYNTEQAKKYYKQLKTKYKEQPSTQLQTPEKKK